MNSKILILLLSVLIISCEKNDDIKPNNSGNLYIKQKSYTQYSDNGTQSYRQEIQYDKNGRENGLKVYSNGILSNQHIDYTFNNNQTIYYSESYTNGVLSSRNKIKIEYLDDLYIKQKSYTQYTNDGTELFHQEIQYDKNGREIGLKVYINGILDTQHVDYTFNNNQTIYYSESYTNGVLSSRNKIKIEYLDDLYIKQKSYTQYTNDGTELFHQEIQYDKNGRENGLKVYSNGVLSNQHIDYAFNNNQTTYNEEHYINGVLYSKNKVEIIYQ